MRILVLLSLWEPSWKIHSPALHLNPEQNPTLASTFTTLPYSSDSPLKLDVLQNVFTSLKYLHIASAIIILVIRHTHPHTHANCIEVITAIKMFYPSRWWQHKQQSPTGIISNRTVTSPLATPPPPPGWKSPYIIEPRLISQTIKCRSSIVILLWRIMILLYII